MRTSLDAALVADLAAQVSGSVLGPQDAGYDSARAMHNGLKEVKRRYDPDNVFHLNHNIASCLP